MNLLNNLSALAENEKYLDSIQGKIDKFNNALRTFWMNFIDSSVIKGIVDTGTKLVQLLDTVHGKILAVVAVWATVRKFKDGVGFKKQFDGVASIVKDVYNAIKITITATQSLTAATLEQTIASKTGNEVLARRIIIDAGLSASTGKLTKKQIKNTVATLNEARADGSLTTAQYLAAMSTMGLKTALQGLWVVLKANPVYAIAAFFVGLGLAIDQFTTTAQEAADAAKEAFDEIQNVVNSTKSTIQSLESELSTLQEKIDALDGGKPSFADSKELEKLKKQRAELEHSLKVQEQLLELQKKSSNDQAIASMKAYTKAASQGAKETQKTANTIGTIIGGLVGVAGIAASVLIPGDFGTIGAGAVAVGSKIASAGGLMAIGGGAYAGNKAGEWAGSKIAENEGTYDSWYETYTKALETARNEEQKALEKYKKDSSNIDKLDKWQEAQQKVSDIETEMYEHLSQMQQYFNGLEYGPDEEINKELDAWYNFLDKFSIEQKASGAEVTALDRIFGENASEEIQSIKEQIMDAIKSGEDFDFESAVNSSEELKGVLDYIGLEAEDVKNYFTQIGEAITTESIKTAGQAYSTLAAEAEKYKDINEVLNELAYDNIEITQEQYDALKELIGSEEEFADCIDTSNGYVVKNTALTKKLVDQKKKEQAADVKLAKSQARLEYYKLVRQLNSTLNGTKALDAATRDSTSSILAQIDAVGQAIYKYQLLEDNLLGVSNAFSDFEEAKEIDALNTYGDSYVEMVQTMYDALYKTGQVGTEQFQAAVKALVPDNIYQGLAEEADRMKAIFDYFNSSIASTLTLKDDTFTLDYSDIENFVKKAIEAKVLLGDIENFDLAKDMNLKKAAELMGITATQAYAFFAELDKYNTGSEQSFLSQLDDSLDGQIMNTITKLEELNTQKKALLEDGDYEKNKAEIDAVNQKIALCEMDLENMGTEAYNAWQEYTKNEAALAALDSIGDKQRALTEAEANRLGIEWDKEKELTVQEAYDQLLAKQLQLEEPTVLTAQLALDTINTQIATLQDTLAKAAEDPTVLGVEAEADQATIDAAKQKIQDQMQALEEDKVLISTEFGIELSEEEKQTLQQELDSIQEFTINDKTFYVIVNGVSETSEALESINELATNESKQILTITHGTREASQELQSVNDLAIDITRTVTTVYREIYDDSYTNGTHSGRYGKFDDDDIDGVTYAGVEGTAHASGSWGAPKTETALTGELGPELLVRGSRWFTVGENGAEFTQVKKGDIIFNHEQTKDLLSKGYVTGRGKLQGGYALASGTAYAGLWRPTDPGSGSGGGSGSGSSADDVEQVIDFIEMKLEEIEAIIEKTSSKIANFLDDTTSIKSKDEFYDELVKAEKDKSEAYLAAAQKYNVEAAAALSGVPKKYQEMAKNGAIAIEDFIGEDQVEIAEKIQEYREWAAKADEAENGYLEAIAAISAHRVEQLEDIATDFENIISITKSHSDLLQAEMDFIEESGGRLSESYYEELKKNSQKQLDDMQAERAALQKILDDAVAAGDVLVGSDDWYSMLQTIYDVDKEIIDCKTDLEKFQNAINELYWDNFDKFIDEIDNVSSELSNLYDLISDDDVVDEMGNWTDKGITALGLLAQQMENAEFKSKQYGEAIEKLKKDYANGLYSVDEYNERLADLTEKQFDSIKSYESAKKAIVDLNKTRVEAVKDGINKEIDAYSELIEKKKEALSADKD